MAFSLQGVPIEVINHCGHAFSCSLLFRICVVGYCLFGWHS